MYFSFLYIAKSAPVLLLLALQEICDKYEMVNILPLKTDLVENKTQIFILSFNGWHST